MFKIDTRYLQPYNEWPHRVTIKNISQIFYCLETELYHFYPLDYRIVERGFTDINLLIKISEYFDEQNLWLNVWRYKGFLEDPSLYEIETKAGRLSLQFDASHGDFPIRELWQQLETSRSLNVREARLVCMDARERTVKRKSTVFRANYSGNVYEEEYQDLNFNQPIPCTHKLFPYFFGVQLQLTDSKDIDMFLATSCMLDFKFDADSFELFLNSRLFDSTEYSGLVRSLRKQEVLNSWARMKYLPSRSIEDAATLFIVGTPSPIVCEIAEAFLPSFLPYHRRDVIDLLNSREVHKQVVYGGSGRKLALIIFKMHQLGFIKVKDVKAWLQASFAYINPRNNEVTFYTGESIRQYSKAGKGRVNYKDDAVWAILKRYEEKVKGEQEKEKREKAKRDKFMSR